MKVISLREHPQLKDVAISYFQNKWDSVWPVIYEDCITHSLHTTSALPQWYLMMDNDEIIGCAGLITNDFISRMDLYPWICALFIEENSRGKELGSLLLQRAKEDALKAGFQNVYLCTDHIGLYEKYGFRYIGQGYHPWKEKSRIYSSPTNDA